MKYSRYSAVIIGSGISGLCLAYELSKNKNIKDGILVLTKSKTDDCNSKLAQGGIVGVMREFNKNDTVSSHMSDTIKAGAGLNDFNAVKFISEYSDYAIKELIKIGVKFDKDEKGNYDFALEGAHSIPRILHTKDKTGYSIEQALIQKVNKSKDIEIYENTMAVELLIDSQNAVRGVLAFNKQEEYEAIFSNAVIIATGGIGQLYKTTTSRPTTTGDGIYLANKAGAEIIDMEFVQFHPTALSVKNNECAPLVSEAVRGEGGKLVNKKNERFILKYDKRGELAPRDIVARAIDEEIKQSNEDCVYLDISDIGVETFKKNFPSITEYCNEYGIDLDKKLIPVSPAAHYLMGGIKVNLDSETNIKNLYAVGEASRTGLHGANRLASNSLLECVVGAISLADYLSYKDLTAPKNYDEKIKDTLHKYEEDEPYYIEDTISIKNKIRDIMWQYAGILRDENSLKKGLFEINELKKEFIGKEVYSNFGLYEVRNMLEIAQIVLCASLNRKNSIGAHYRIDSTEIQKIEHIEDREIGKISVK